MGFGIKINHQSIQIIWLHTSRCHYCHYCNVDFMLFHNVTCYSNSLLFCIHVNTPDLLNMTCTLVATGVILGRLECTYLNVAMILHLCWMDEDGGFHPHTRV